MRVIQVVSYQNLHKSLLRTAARIVPDRAYDRSAATRIMNTHSPSLSQPTAHKSAVAVLKRQTLDALSLHSLLAVMALTLLWRQSYHYWEVSSLER